MKVSVVIVAEEVNDYVRENIGWQIKQEFQDFEILLILSKETSEVFPKTRVIVRPDLAGNPAQRRDLSIVEAQGEILAFIDDDAYPSNLWLASAWRHFEDIKIGAVGGPGVTPPEDSWRQKVSGWVQASPMGGSLLTFFRFRPITGRREVDDYPSMNLLVRKSDFAMIGGFDSNFYPGEDTKLCLDLTQKLGKKIIYDPEVLVYHHRRPIFKGHLRQIGGYGLHRGFFARTLPQTSRRIIYFMPPSLVVFLFFTPLLAWTFKIFNFQFSSADWQINFQFLLPAYFLILTTYFLLLLLNSIWGFGKTKDFKVSFWLLPAVFLTHLWYGIQFLRGIISRKLTR